VSRNLSTSFWFSNLLAYNFPKIFPSGSIISVDLLYISLFSSLILLTWLFPVFLLVSSAKSILFIFPKIQLFVSLILCSVLLVSFISALIFVSWSEPFLSLPCWEWASSHSWLLLNLTGLNWAVTGDAEKTQDRQTESGVRCVGHSGGDTQPYCFFSPLFFSFTLLLFSIFLL
jgi:hypothetical protein